MTDAPAPASTAVPPPVSRSGDESLSTPIVVYVLYLVGYFTGGLTTLIGLVVAYLQKGDAGPRAASHYVFLINTFWITLAALAAAALLCMLGFPLLFLHGAGVVLFILSTIIGAVVTVWFLVRCVVGLVRAAQGDAYPAPRAWLL